MALSTVLIALSFLTLSMAKRMLRSWVRLAFAEDRAESDEKVACRLAGKQKPTDQVGYGYTLPPRSTAVGVISLSAV